MCDDVNEFIKEMQKHKITCAPVQNQGWGMLTQITLPGGGQLSIYQSRHARPKPMQVKGNIKKASKSSLKKKGLKKSVKPKKK